MSYVYLFIEEKWRKILIEFLQNVSIFFSLLSLAFDLFLRCSTTTTTKNNK